ncbi:MAG: hypothetical protein WAW09_07695, partial [Smithella sp.]
VPERESAREGIIALGSAGRSRSAQPSGTINIPAEDFPKFVANLLHLRQCIVQLNGFNFELKGGLLFKRE